MNYQLQYPIDAIKLVLIRFLSEENLKLNL